MTFESTKYFGPYRSRVKLSTDIWVDFCKRLLDMQSLVTTTLNAVFKDLMNFRETE